MFFCIAKIIASSEIKIQNIAKAKYFKGFSYTVKSRKQGQFDYHMGVSSSLYSSSQQFDTVFFIKIKLLKQ